MTQTAIRKISSFREDVITGLSSNQKYLHSKYFYDERGDELFQQIMNADEYYLTNAEFEIFRSKSDDILRITKNFNSTFDLIELGAGDAMKSTELLKKLTTNGCSFNYIPIDISSNIINGLEEELPRLIPGLNIRGIADEYFSGLERAKSLSNNSKLVLFLGGNIGNMSPEEALNFCRELYQHLDSGDIVLIGFDLKKNPWTIFNAYNDKNGLTKAFNLNLLHRINQELEANFDISTFDHYESYDPESGACKSYLFSLKDQSVLISGVEIVFKESECIYMETSHKYSIEQSRDIAKAAGFTPITELFDTKRWFADVIWKVS